MPKPTRNTEPVRRDEAAIEYLETLLADAERTSEESTGIAKVQAIKLCRDLATEIDRARAALVITKDEIADLSEEEIVERMRDAARDMPTAHLEVFVHAWLERGNWVLTVDEGRVLIGRPSDEVA